MIANAPLVALLVACAGVAVLADRRRWSPPVWLTLLVALLLRVVVAVIAKGHTPHDMAIYTQNAGRWILAGHDPLLSAPRYQWNYLPLSAYMYALVVKTGITWEYGVKIFPVACDLATVALVRRLAPRLGRLRAFQYALMPLALLVVSWHGQFDPIAVPFALAALLVAGRGSATAGGLLAGVAITVKTWPVIFVPALLRAAGRRWARAAIAAAGVPLAFLLTMPLFLDTRLVQAAKVIARYRSITGTWGWTGLYRLLVDRHAIGYSGPAVDQEARIGTLLLVLAVLVVTAVWWRAEPAVLVTATLLAFYVATAGFGPQYLFWVLPLLVARPNPRAWLFVVLASAYAMGFYLSSYWQHHVDVWVWASLPVIAAALLALPFDERRRTVHLPDTGPRRIRAARPATASLAAGTPVIGS